MQAFLKSFLEESNAKRCLIFMAFWSTQPFVVHALTKKTYVIAIFKNETFLCEQKKYISGDLKKVSDLEFESEDDCSSSPNFEKAKEAYVINQASEKKLREENEENQRKKSISEFLIKNPKFKSFESACIDRKIKIGMPRELLYLSWGSPSQINSTVVRGMTSEQLIYGTQYVYLRNGIISAWQTTTP